MKKILFSTLVIAAMASCSSDPVSEAENTDLVEIKLTSSVTSSTRAPIISDGLGVLKDDLVIKFLRAADAAIVDWTTGTTEVGATIKKTTGSVEFDPKQYYNIDAAERSHLFGYYVDNAETSFADGKLTVPIGDNLDILYADPVSGDKGNNGALSIAFKHALAWVKVNVKGDAAAATNWGAVTGITIKNVAENVIITIGDTPIIAYDENTVDLQLTGSVGLTDASNEFGDYLVNPKDAYNLVITTENGTATISVDVTGGAEAGKISNINLTFKGSEITATATVTEWATGNDADQDVL